MSVGIIPGNCSTISTVSVSWTPAEVATITAPAQTVTVPGVKVGDVILVTPPGQQAGVTIGSARASAANTVSVQFVNPTGSGVTPTAGTYKFTVIRQDQTLGYVVS